MVGLVVLGAAVAAGPASGDWITPTDLAPANAAGNPVGSPSLAVAPDGTAFVAFDHFDGTHDRAGVVMRAPGGGFGAVRDLSPAGQDVFGGVVAVDHQGNVTLAYASSTDAAVEVRYRPVGQDWSDPVKVAASGSFGPVALAVGDNGAAVVAWQQSATSTTVVGATRAAATQPFSTPVPISNASSGLNFSCQTPRVAMDPAGDAAAIWTRRINNGAAYMVEAAVKAAGTATSWSAQTMSSGSSPCNSDIQIAPDGRVEAMWDESGSPGFVARRDRTTPFGIGQWTPPFKLGDTTRQGRKPTFVVDDAGVTSVIWLAEFGTSEQVVSAFRPAVDPFSAPFALTGATANSGQAISAGAGGDAMAAFVGDSAGNDAVFAARRRPGVAFDPPLPVAVAPADVSFNAPDVAIDNQGNAFAVWQRDASNTFSVQVAGFDPVPPVIAAVNVPSGGTAGQAVAMSAAASDRMSAPALHFAFGDGSGADGGSVQHVYATAGSYTVTVTATDAAGNKNSQSRAIQVAPAPPPPAIVVPVSKPAGPQRLLAVATLSWDRLRNGRTRLKKLVIEGLAGPETVRLSCKGKGCRKSANRTIRKHKRTLSLTKYVKGMALHPKATLMITVTQAGSIRRILTYTMVKHGDPKKSIRCLPPGTRKAQAC
jgi:hypothetical protein